MSNTFDPVFVKGS